MNKHATALITVILSGLVGGWAGYILGRSSVSTSAPSTPAVAGAGGVQDVMPGSSFQNQDSEKQQKLVPLTAATLLALRPAYHEKPGRHRRITLTVVALAPASRLGLVMAVPETCFESHRNRLCKLQLRLRRVKDAQFSFKRKSCWRVARGAQACARASILACRQRTHA